MSALYLSKVAPQDSTCSPLKPTQGQSSESGKRVNVTKMAEDSQRRKDGQSGQEDISGAHLPQSTPSQLSKEKLYQQRQKCELRRLLKHTHPELKMLDEAVDEELAEVLSSDAGATAGETGYEGEVLSRRLIFENCALSNKVSPFTPKMAEGTVERGDGSKTSAVSEKHENRPCNERHKGIVEDDKMLCSSPDPDRESVEEMIRIDVRATRRMFENQCVNTSTLNPDNKFNGKVSISGDVTGAVQKGKQEVNLHGEKKTNACTNNLDWTDQPNKQGPCVNIIGQSSGHEVSTDETVFEGEPEEFGEIIRTSAALFLNNPFIPTNIEREHSFGHTSTSHGPAGDSGAAQDCLVANVKDRAHLFESMPFDQIQHQNKDEIETMVENIKETLNSLYQFNAIHSDGAIIEVNETMIAKKAKFTLSESGPEIKYDEVAEGGAQNFIHQLLPRANLKPQITYLKEGSKGSMKTTVLDVPVHQHHITTNHDTEIKTANVVQLVEDILNQDNSLRKGVIIQEDADRCAQVIVYSLYNYFDEEDVKSYYPPQGSAHDEPEPERGDVSKAVNQELRKGVIESTISCLLETPKDQACQGSITPEITVKGNVKLFKSCIEKGDLEYLKTLQAEPTEQEHELPPNQNVAGQGMEPHHDQAEESTSEWVPVDVKRLKNMFSGDQTPTKPKQNTWDNPATMSCAFTGQNLPLGKTQSSTECIHAQVKHSFGESVDKTQEACNSKFAPQGSYLHLETQDDGRVHQAELVEVVDDNEISNLQTAIQSLQQATMEAKALHHSSEENLNFHVRETVSVTADNTKHSRMEAELPQKNEDQKEDPCNITSDLKSDCHPIQSETTSEEVQTAMVSVHSPEVTAQEQEDGEVVFQGKLQAALDSLQRSNINVSRGDFRAAMIYRNTSKPYKERSQTMDAVSAKTEPESRQAPLRQEVSKVQVTAANAEPPSQSETLNKPATSALSEKSKMPVGPKPVIPPKPEHLKVKQRDNQSTNTKNPAATQANTARLEETASQPLVSHKDEHKPDSVDHQNKLSDEATQMSQGIEVRQQAQGAVVTFESDNTDKNINQRQEINATAEEKSSQDFPIKENMNEPDESHVDFHEAFKKFGGKKAFSGKNAPVKPKRVKIAQSDKNPKHMSGRVVEEPQQPPTADSKDKHDREIKQESKVEMREKKGRMETEDERRQRLSVHMDEIMRGNITAAMEIFDNLRKQEELKSILSRVEEIEQDTSEVDVRSLRGVFENVPDWVVSSDKKKHRKAKLENTEERSPLTRDNTESQSSMAHVFGDLERASEEIMNLKEQTLARLVDIEEAIKKALYSVSTLKSDSDIAGLSCLFKESLGAEQGSPSSGNISKISIGSSRTKSQQVQERYTTQGNTVSQTASIEVASAKQASPPSSPAFISIQSAARKADKTEALPPQATICPTCLHSPKTEKYRTTKTLTCNSPAQNRKRDPRKGGQSQVSVVEVKTDREGNKVTGTKTVTENYERTDNFGNRFYSSKTSTVVSAQPENTSSTGQNQNQVTRYPEVRLPINQKP